MKNKKIGFEAKRALHNFRGLGNYSRGVIEGLVEHYPDNEYYLFSPTPKDERAKQWLKSLPQLKLVTPGTLGSLSASTWRSVWLGRIAQKYNLDLFHGLSHELPPFGLDCPQVVTIHDLIYLRYPEFFPAIDRLVYDRKFKTACHRANKVIAICDQTKRDLVEFFKLRPTQIEIAYQSVSASFYHLLSSAQVNKCLERYEIQNPYYFYVGALEERKNALTLVRAFAEIKEQTPNDLVIVGEGKDYEQRVRDLIKELNVGSRVHLLGRARYEDLPALYQGAQALCFPSFFEGFGLPIVEALFSQTPVITSTGSCFPESGGPESLYVDPHQYLELAKAMLSLAEDSFKVSQMVSVGHEYAQRFHNLQTTRRLVEIYQQVMNRNDN